MLIAGIDLAWGEEKPDGVCFIHQRGTEAWIGGYAYPRGDEALLAAIAGVLPHSNPAFLAIDAPIVCPNATGGRPVDAAISRMFWREHAGCHSANSTRCPRPPRILAWLASLGFVAGSDLKAASRVVAEVYPHPAMVRLFQLPRILRYNRKRGRSRSRCADEYARYGQLLTALLANEFPSLALDDGMHELLRSPWSKSAEDRLDALFCALIGLWHVQHRGRRSESVGDLATGFVLLPEDVRSVG